MATGQKEMNTKEGKIHFKVDSALLFQLGEQLVAKRSLALAELIKNAYDADATTVTVHLKNVKEKGGSIIVKDNGTGMTFEDVQRAWMTIGTPEKVERPLSSVYFRPRTGDKGVGRFAARRIANKLVLHSVSVDKESKNRLEYVEVEFDWENYKQGLKVDQVSNRFKRQYINNSEPCGVTLELIDVRDAWLKDDVNQLQKELTSVLSPFPEKKAEKNQKNYDPGFSITIIADEFPEYAGPLEDQFLKSSYGTLRGTLNKKGKPAYTLSFRNDVKSENYSGQEGKFQHLGPLDFIVYFFPLQQEYFTGTNFSVTQARQIAQEHAGIKVFFNNFRVPPYGDLGDDWLSIDKDRANRITTLPSELVTYAKNLDRPMLMLPGNNTLFGGVFLTRDSNPELQLTLNRERLLETEAFNELKKFVRFGVNWMTVMHAKRVAERGKNRFAQQPREKPAQLVARAIEQVEKAPASLPKEDKSEILQVLRLAEESLEKREEEHITELSMLRVLASTGTMIVVFEHQLLGVLSGLKESHKNLEELLAKLGIEKRREFSQITEMLKDWIEDADSQGELLGLLMGRDSRSRSKRLAIRPVVENISRSFRTYMEEMGIEFINDVQPSIRTLPMFECELTAILMNLMTNSLKALRQQPVRRIKVSTKRTKNRISVLFADTGIGVSREKWEDYFKPFYGESEPDIILGHGTGLGLKIVKDLVDLYGGNVQFKKPDKSWNTTIEIMLPEN